MINIFSLLGACAVAGLSASTGLKTDLPRRVSFSKNNNSFSWTYRLKTDNNTAFLDWYYEVSTHTNSNNYYSMLCYSDSSYNGSVDYHYSTSASSSFQAQLEYFNTHNDFYVGFLDMWQYDYTNNQMLFKRAYLGGVGSPSFIVQGGYNSYTTENIIRPVPVYQSVNYQQNGYTNFRIGTLYDSTSFDYLNFQDNINQHIFTLSAVDNYLFENNLNTYYGVLGGFYLSSSYSLSQFSNLIEVNDNVQLEPAVSNGYDDIYQAGYNAGVGYGMSYQRGEDLSEIQASYQEGYSAGVQESEQSSSTALTIFTGIINVALLPVNVFLKILNFEVFGINIGGLVSAFLTISIVLILWRIIAGGKNND